MQKKELLFPEKFESYEYKFEEKQYDTYSFQTVNGVVYDVVFKPSPYIFNEDAIYAPYLFELLLAVQESKAAKLESDEKIPFTIVSILLDFYNRNDNNVCVYICDSSEGKQLARARKFNYWFSYFNEGGFIQMTEVFKDSDGIKYPIGMILKIKNSFKAQIIEAFESLVSEYDKE